VSPTQRSLAYLREQGFVCEVVEHRRGAKTVDPFGVDIVGVREGETIGCQTTSMSNIASRVRRLTEHPDLPALRAAGWRVVVHGWAGARLKEVDLS
jgi:hypothetical protein